MKISYTPVLFFCQPYLFVLSSPSIYFSSFKLAVCEHRAVVVSVGAWVFCMDVSVWRVTRVCFVRDAPRPWLRRHGSLWPVAVRVVIYFFPRRCVSGLILEKVEKAVLYTSGRCSAVYCPPLDSNACVLLKLGEGIVFNQWSLRKYKNPIATGFIVCHFLHSIKWKLLFDLLRCKIKYISYNSKSLQITGWRVK